MKNAIKTREKYSTTLVSISLYVKNASIKKKTKLSATLVTRRLGRPKKYLIANY